MINIDTSVKPGSHLRHNDIMGKSRKRKKCLVLMFYEHIDIGIKLIFSLCHYDHVVMSLCRKCEPGLTGAS